MDETTSLSPKGINWSSALVAGLVATVAITITMALFGTNIMKMLGSTMLGENASVAAQYTVGGMFHLMVGLIWGILYAWLFGPIVVWNRFLKGVVFGLAITAIALATMPVMMAMMGGDGAANPCAANPCAANPCAANPCAANPCAANPCAAEPYNPCAPTAAAENPCAPDAGNPCQPSAAAGNPCNPPTASETKALTPRGMHRSVKSRFDPSTSTGTR